MVYRLTRPIDLIRLCFYGMKYFPEEKFQPFVPIRSVKFFAGSLFPISCRKN